MSIGMDGPITMNASIRDWKYQLRTIDLRRIFKPMKRGNFYYLKCTEEGRTAHGGSVVRVSPDGASFDLFATGLRNPNGLGMGPNGMMMLANSRALGSLQAVSRWSSKVGFMVMCHRITVWRFRGHSIHPCWIPHGMDNSSGAQVWSAPDERWGPLSGRWLHLSYGKCQLFQVLMEKTPVQGIREAWFGFRMLSLSPGPCGAGSGRRMGSFM